MKMVFEVEILSSGSCGVIFHFFNSFAPLKLRSTNNLHLHNKVLHEVTFAIMHLIAFTSI